MASTETRKMVLAAAAACEDKKAENTRVLELDPADSGFTDFFLITSAANDRQSQAIGDEIDLRLKREFGTYPHSVEGRKVGEWILMDYVDFVVHIFLEEKRAFYDLERLWKSAQPVDLEELKAALKEKTLAARKKTTGKKTASAVKKAPSQAKKKAVAAKTAPPKKRAFAPSNRKKT
jgi:ribosome-associated protein